MRTTILTQLGGHDVSNNETFALTRRKSSGGRKRVDESKWGKLRETKVFLRHRRVIPIQRRRLDRTFSPHVVCTASLMCSPAPTKRSGKLTLNNRRSFQYYRSLSLPSTAANTAVRCRRRRRHQAEQSTVEITFSKSYLLTNRQCM